MSDQPDEATALLAPTPSPLERRSVLHTIVSAAVLLITLTIGSQIAIASQIAILEDLVCQKYYSDRGNSPFVLRECKIEPIQSEVAWINGWKDVVEIFPAILLAVPYGALADRIGRKKVLILAIVGCFLNDAWIRIVYWLPGVFPLRAVWLGGLWQTIGAGAVTLSSITFVLVADVCPADQRVTAFSQMHCAALLAEFVSIPIGAALMSLSPWIPMFVSSAMTILGLFVVLFLVPETLPPDGNGASKWLPRSETGDMPRSAIVSWVQHRMAALVSVGKWAVNNAKVAAVLLAILFYHIGEASIGPLLLQYASKRLGWTLAKASHLLSLKAGLSIVVLAILIPALSRYLLQYRHLHTIAKDKRIAQISGILLTVGSVVLFISTSWVLLVIGQSLISLGWAFSVPARSLITGMVKKDELATVYTAISILTYGGILLGTPLMVAAFQWGMKLGYLWVGMPFLVAGVSFSMATVAVSVTTTEGTIQED